MSLKPYRAVPWLRRVFAGLLLRKPGYTPGSVHVGYVVEKLYWKILFIDFFRFPLCQCQSAVALHSHI